MGLGADWQEADNSRQTDSKKAQPHMTPFKYQIISFIYNSLKI